MLQLRAVLVAIAVAVILIVVYSGGGGSGGAHFARTAYGQWLLGATAAGLLAYGVFGLLQSRYHRV